MAGYRRTRRVRKSRASRRTRRNGSRKSRVCKRCHHKPCTCRSRRHRGGTGRVGYNPSAPQLAAMAAAP